MGEMSDYDHSAGSLRSAEDRIMDPERESSKLATVVRVTSGNFLEMFDFFLFGFYASHIAHAFFPSDNEITSLLFTFMTFGAGFLMRPLGAIVLGAYVDRVGRRLGLIVTLSIMAMGTILIAFVPSYATIGAQLISIVPSRGLWVDANFKEDQLAHMKVGQPVTVKVDAYPDGAISGHVASF